jgi:arylsulfatase A-like enzyme
MAYLAQRNLAAAHIADFDKRRGRDGYTNTAPTPLDDDAYCDNWIARNGLELLRAAPKGKPWHLVVNFAGPHNPVDITSSMERVARGRNFPQPHRNTQVDAPVHNALRQNYAAMLENIDRWLGEYSEELRRRGEWNNTIIVYSSDHGEMLGDHDRWAKGVPHEASVRVPLVMAGPGIGRGQSPELVYVHDLAATYLDYGGVPTPSDMDSKSLRPLLEGKTRSHRKHLRLGLYEWRAVTDGRYKLVKNFDNKPVQLFDLRQDPWEDEDIATRQPAQVKRLEALLR